MADYVTLQQEEFSVAYVHAMAAVLGCSMNRYNPDNKGFDWTLTNQIPRARFSSGSVNVQLKSTTQPCIFNKGEASFPLKAQHYKALIAPSMVPSLLVILYMPKKKSEWLDFDSNRLHLYNRAYWWSSEDAPPIPKGQKSISIKIKQENLLTPEALSEILTNTANNKTPTGKRRA